jgi:hypothetical protein
MGHARSDNISSPVTSQVTLEIDRETIGGLRTEAARRDVSTTRLIGDLLDAIVGDRLVGAILDR